MVCAADIAIIPAHGSDTGSPQRSENCHWVKADRFLTQTSGSRVRESRQLAVGAKDRKIGRAFGDFTR
jgi:hypothetical protein